MQLPTARTISLAKFLVSGANTMSDAIIKQAQIEEILTFEVSDEFLESAAGNKQANNVTFFFCTALIIAPVPSHRALKSAIACSRVGETSSIWLN